MPEARVIKKYPNRRLYDTEQSRYIKLADVRTLVLDDVAFVVIDKKTGNDITRNILLQVISDGGQQGEPLMSRTFLSQVIHACGRVPGAAAAAYLEQCLDAYVRRQCGTRGPVPVVEVASVHRGRWHASPDGASRRAAGDAGDADLPHDRIKAG